MDLLFYTPPTYEDVIAQTIQSMNQRYTNLFIWFFILVCGNVFLYELWKGKKLNIDTYMKYQYGILVGYVGISIMLLFP